MNAKQIYPIIHKIVKRKVSSQDPPSNLKRFWDFANRIPDPKEIESSLASAICTSVSHSTKHGLEAFYQEPLLWDDVAPLIMGGVVSIDEPTVAHLQSFFFEDDGKQTLGDFVRSFFNGRKVLNDEDQLLLTTIMSES